MPEAQPAATTDAGAARGMGGASPEEEDDLALIRGGAQKADDAKKDAGEGAEDDVDLIKGGGTGGAAKDASGKAPPTPAPSSGEDDVDLIKGKK
jgi:hypothetical protein